MELKNDTRESIGSIDGQGYEIWHNIPKGYYVKVKSGPSIGRDYFETKAKAEEHAELSLLNACPFEDKKTRHNRGQEKYGSEVENANTPKSWEEDVEGLLSNGWIQKAIVTKILEKYANVSSEQINEHIGKYSKKKEVKNVNVFWHVTKLKEWITLTGKAFTMANVNIWLKKAVIIGGLAEEIIRVIQRDLKDEVKNAIQKGDTASIAGESGGFTYTVKRIDGDYVWIDDDIAVRKVKKGTLKLVSRSL